jgi:thermitase
MPQEHIGAELNGKPCEIVVSQNQTEIAYQLNPQLDSQEREWCQREIKQALRVQSEQELATQFVAGEILVRFRDRPTSSHAALSQARRIGLNVDSVQMRSGWVKFQLAQRHRISTAEAKAQTLEAVASVLESDDVEWAEPNYLARASSTTSITPTWGQRALGIEQAWSVASCDLSVGVAVIDTGIAITHTEFAGGTAIHGWDFVNGDSLAEDDNGHGTHVASTVAGHTVGVCPGGTVVAYKVLDHTGSGTHDDIAAGIISATNDSRVKILNLSLGSFSSSSVLQDAIDQATASKLVFSASGNALGEYPEYPARYAGVTPVGAIDRDWRLATFSTRFQGTTDRSLVAPGVDVWGAHYSCPSCYVAQNGTSMATPHAAGAAALLWSAVPSLTAGEVKDYLLDNTVELGDSREYGRGGLHVGSAVKAATGATYNLPPIVAWTLPFPSHGNPGDELGVLALLRDPDGSVVSATAVISSSQGGSLATDLVANDMDLWEASFAVGDLGVYTATVSASDGSSTSVGLGSVEFRIVSSTLPSGWPQHGQQPSGGSYLPYTISDTTPIQLYEQDIGAGNRETVAVSNGRADVPASVRIVSSPACPLGNDYGRRWLFDPLQGISHPDAITLSCLDGVGMFGNSAAIGGLAFSLDEGSGRSDSQDSRLHAFDPWTGRQYWLIQLNHYGDSFVKTSSDGRYIYTVHGTYDGLWRVDLMGRRQWFFRPERWSTVRAAPVESDGRVFVRVDSSASGLYALDAEDGSVLWQYPIGSSTEAAVPVVSPDGSIVVFCRRALRASDGAHLWSGVSCESTPAVTQDYVIQYASRHLTVRDLDTGVVLTSTEVIDYGSSWSSPAVVGDTVFIANYDGKVQAYRLPTLEKVWQGTIDPYNISNWQMSAAVGEDAGGQYCLVFASGNNGYFKAWRWPCEPDASALSFDLSKLGPREATPSAEISYTIVVTNTSIGAVTLSGIATDTVTTSGGTKHTAGWEVAVGVDDVYTHVYSITVQPGFTGIITNTVTVEFGSGLIDSASVTTRVWKRVYAPLVIRD